MKKEKNIQPTKILMVHPKYDNIIVLSKFPFSNIAIVGRAITIRGAKQKNKHGPLYKIQTKNLKLRVIKLLSWKSDN